MIGLEFEFQVELWLCVHIWFVLDDQTVGTHLGKNQQKSSTREFGPNESVG